MKKKRVVKCILSIIGIIVLGAIGSGFWDLAMKPVFIWFLELILKITTLGISSLSDKFYHSVAREQSDDLSVLILMFVIFLIWCNFSWWYFQMKILSYTKEEKEEMGQSDKWLPKAFRIFMLIALFVMVFQMSQAILRDNYISTFHQKFRIAQLAMNEREEEIILAKFSTIQNKQDYFEVLVMLQEKIIDDVIQNIEPPKPKP